MEMLLRFQQQIGFHIRKCSFFTQKATELFSTEFIAFIEKKMLVPWKNCNHDDNLNV